MESITEMKLNFNSRVKISFDGGELSSDTGEMLLAEFMEEIGVRKQIEGSFKTRDNAIRIHTDSQNLMQALLQIFAGYFRDDCADHLMDEPVMKAILHKDALASQPTMSRFFSRMDADTALQLNEIVQALRRKIYAIKRPEYVLLDLDSTLLPAYGNQEGVGYNVHYSSVGYHPLVCYDGLTGDPIRVELRNGTEYCGKDAADFLRPIFIEFKTYYPDIKLFFRGDSGFAMPEIYDLCEEFGVKYVIRLKQNSKLTELSRYLDDILDQHAQADVTRHDTVYGQFIYQAQTWKRERRVVCKIDRAAGQFLHTPMFIVTNIEADALSIKDCIALYCNRGTMENFIKESKNGFGFGMVGSSKKIVNSNRLLIHMLAQCIFNWFRRLVLPKGMAKMTIGTLRLKLIKIASRVISSGRYLHFKICSSCPYLEEFALILENIHSLMV